MVNKFLINLPAIIQVLPFTRRIFFYYNRSILFYNHPLNRIFLAANRLMRNNSQPCLKRLIWVLP
jgi:hypothetical protein